MPETGEVGVVSHIVKMIKENDNLSLEVYLDLVKGNEAVINELKTGLSDNPEARQLIVEKAPEVMGLK